MLIKILFLEYGIKSEARNHINIKKPRPIIQLIIFELFLLDINLFLRKVPNASKKKKIKK